MISTPPNSTPKHVLTRLRILPAPPASHIVAIIIVRNEAWRLPEILRHHRALGVDRFAVLDNNSHDATRDIVLAEPDVDLWYTENSFGESAVGARWRNALAKVYGPGRWYLLIDADEMLVYAGMEANDLHRVARRLSYLEMPALRAPMVDMYAEESIELVGLPGSRPLIELCPYYDGIGYAYRKYKSGETELIGGPRTRLLSTPEKSFNNVLEKYPFMMLRDNTVFRNIHANPYPGHIVPPLGALLHFKFLGDFSERIDVAIKEKQYWNNSTEYVAYSKMYNALRKPYFEHSKKYEGPRSLIETGIIKEFPW
jgi:hypothetical protein